MPMTLSRDATNMVEPAKFYDTEDLNGHRGALVIDSDDSIYVVVEDAAANTALARVRDSHLDLDCCVDWPVHLAPSNIAVSFRNQ